MEANPTGSETIETSAEPVQDPVVEFKKGRAKREAKRKEVKVITEYVPEPPAETKAELVPEPPLPAPDADSIAARVAEMLFAKMAAEKNDLDKENTPPNKTKPKPRAAPKKKDKSPPPSPPPTKYFGWC